MALDCKGPQNMTWVQWSNVFLTWSALCQSWNKHIPEHGSQRFCMTMGEKSKVKGFRGMEVFLGNDKFLGEIEAVKPTW